FTLSDDPEALSDLEREWKWMSAYRIWEANRKVFLYPENWVRPEWRTNKSHLFRELESQLLQGHLTDDRAELAYRTYLAGLEEIAKLDPKAMVEHHASPEGTACGKGDAHVLATSGDRTGPKWF